MTEDLAGWLLEQIAEDMRRREEFGETHGVQCAARAATEWDHRCRCGFADRVQAECESKQRIVHIHQMGTVYHEDHFGGDRVDVPEWFCIACADRSAQSTGVLVGDEGREEWPCQTLRVLALPYADRPGYREEWRP